MTSLQSRITPILSRPSAGGNAVAYGTAKELPRNATERLTFLLPG